MNSSNNQKNLREIKEKNEKEKESRVQVKQPEKVMSVMQHTYTAHGYSTSTIVRT